MTTTFDNVTLNPSHVTKETAEKVYIYNATEEAPVISTNYPWGRKFRTERKWWVETNKEGRQRLAYTTKDPKRGHWCAVKRSTYSDLTWLVINKENGHVMTGGLDFHYLSDKDKAQTIIDLHGEGLGEEVVKRIKVYTGINEKISQNFKQAEEQERKRLEEAKPLDLTEKVIFSQKEVRHSGTSLELYELKVQGRGIKKRCRKADFHSFIIGYTSRERGLEEIAKAAQPHIEKIMQEHFREVSSLGFYIGEARFKVADTKNPLFASFETRPMESVYRQKLVG